MKVVIAHNRYASAAPSGENIIVDIEIAQLTEAGIEVLPLLRSSDEISDLPVAQRALLPFSPLYNGASQKALRQILREHQPDLMHLHNPYPLLSPWVVRTAHRHGVPVIQTVHNYRQICASGLFFRDGAICRECVGRRFGAPAVRHGCYRGSRAQSVIMAGTLAAHRGTWHQVDRYIALTSSISQHLLEFGIPQERITVKPNSVADPGPAPSDPGNGFLFAARLSPEKGLALLLEAWATHPVGALGTLRIAGDGPQRPLAQAAAAQRADVEYLGQCDSQRVRSLIRAASCVVATPTWHDVLPTIGLEALANGRPLLATAMGGLPDIVRGEARPDRAAGWVVPPTVSGVADGLLRAAEGTAGTVPDYGQLARQRYEQNFSPEVITRRLIGIYQEVIGR